MFGPATGEYMDRFKQRESPTPDFELMPLHTGDNHPDNPPPPSLVGELWRKTGAVVGALREGGADALRYIRQAEEHLRAREAEQARSRVDPMAEMTRLHDEHEDRAQARRREEEDRRTREDEDELARRRAADPPPRQAPLAIRDQELRNPEGSRSAAAATASDDEDPAPQKREAAAAAAEKRVVPPANVRKKRPVFTAPISWVGKDRLPTATDLQRQISKHQRLFKEDRITETELEAASKQLYAAYRAAHAK